MNDEPLTFESYAAVIRALVPETQQLSLHDATGQTVWMSGDFLRPEDQAIASEALRDLEGVDVERDYVVREEGPVLAALNLRGPDGMLSGVLLLECSAEPKEGWPLRRLAMRLAAILACLGAELQQRAARVVAGAGVPLHDAPMLMQITSALREERFELFLQPILPLHAELELLRFEVLLRLRTPDGAVLSPGAFLPVAARHGLMPDIDRWVVRTLLAFLMNHRKRWFRIPSVFAVNLAGESLRDPGFLDFVESCIAKSGVAPEALCFELSVASAAAGSATVGAAMRRLGALGCAVAIDDFGTSDLAYAYLKDLPTQYIKIDRALVGSAHHDRLAGAVVSGIVHMAQMLGAQTVAEAIESQEELTAMRSLGVDFAQGFLLGRPAALKAIDFSAARSAALMQLGTAPGH